jgi:hypothetical protein
MKMHSPLLLVALLSLAVTTGHAGQTLFEDYFGQRLPRALESRGDFNTGTDQRQSGSLAPADYTHNGEDWQAQTQFNAAEGAVCRLFPSQTWLVASPAWELDAADGRYEIVFEFSHPDSTTQQQTDQNKPPAPTTETVLLLGQGLPDPAAQLQPANGLAVVYRTNPELPSLLLMFGQQVGEFRPTATGENHHTIKLRWRQEGGAMRDIEAELDGVTLKDDGVYSLATPKLLFGARGRYATDYEASGVSCLNVLQLSYTKL